MAWNHNILLLFLLLLLFPSSNGAIYRVHNFRLQKVSIYAPMTFGFLPKDLPIPPSAPSKRHNDHQEGEGPVSSARDGGDHEPYLSFSRALELALLAFSISFRMMMFFRNAWQLQRQFYKDKRNGKL
ncbi:unnamed protein product [Dovyalis caffra]|uniref:Transmembrane protein n=1 Tax=Dovyalis caffra TaxID=77055 RepID=A0AAV1RG10_9ROSI|nr:unnamed protein product [Dovyalis caffra]